MTRINLVEPEQLTYEHLIAEYRELPRIFTAIQKAVEKGKTLKDFDIPDCYVLGTGHCKFFYDKCSYLMGRWVRISSILARRHDCNLSQEFIDSVYNNYSKIPQGFKDNGWQPLPEEIYLNMYRLANRHFFKLTNDDKDAIVVEITKDRVKNV